jgi:hypothetical protein
MVLFSVAFAYFYFGSVYDPFFVGACRGVVLGPLAGTFPLGGTQRAAPWWQVVVLTATTAGLMAAHPILRSPNAAVVTQFGAILWIVWGVTFTYAH